MALKGRCACGRVTYQINDEPLFTQACHCLDCQRTTGSAFVVHMVVAEQDFSIDGELNSSVIPTGSGKGCEIYACSHCSTFIWCRYLYHKVPVIAVRSGTLLDPNAVRPQAHLFTASKQTWMTLSDEVPVFDGMSDRGAVWPMESVQKYDSLPLRE
jgi:hypothetical protein